MATNNTVFNTAFAASGDMTAIPDGKQANGAVSWAEGFGAKYSLSPNEGGLQIGREQFNQLGNNLSRQIIENSDRIESLQTQLSNINLTSLRNQVNTNTNNIATNTMNINILKNGAGIRSGYQLMTLVIDESNPDPEGAITVLNDAKNTTAALMLSWLGLRPVLFVNGAVNSALNPNNYAQYSNGLAADITTLGNDVMVEFPKRLWKITKKDRKVYCYLTNDTQAEGFVDYAWYRGTATDWRTNTSLKKNNFYMGAYPAYVSSNKMYSSSGKSPSCNIPRANFRTYANNRGTGYCQLGHFQWLYYQLTYLFCHRSRNAQLKIGKGWSGGSWGSGQYQGKAGGVLNDKGANYGDQTGTTLVKCNYIESPWGNMWILLDNYYLDGNNNVLVTPGKPDDTTWAGYIDAGRAATANSDTYTREVMGTSEGGFVPTLTNGAETKNYCDNYWFGGNNAFVGGGWGDGGGCGVFALISGNVLSYAYVDVGARLCYI